MSDKRMQGRPCRGTMEVGREKILEALRTLLRSNPDYDLSRKSLANAAGVTPALISYYFPRKQQLLIEAVEPLIQVYASEMAEIVYANSDRETRLRELTQSLTRLYKTDSRVLSVYQDLMRRRQLLSNNNLLEKMANCLDDFVLELSGKPSKATFDAAVLQGAVWGMCDFAARAGKPAPCERAPREHDLVDALDLDVSTAILPDHPRDAVVSLLAMPTDAITPQAGAVA